VNSGWGWFYMILSHFITILQIISQLSITPCISLGVAICCYNWYQSWCQPSARRAPFGAVSLCFTCQACTWSQSLRPSAALSTTCCGQIWVFCACRISKTMRSYTGHGGGRWLYMYMFTHMILHTVHSITYLHGIVLHHYIMNSCFGYHLCKLCIYIYRNRQNYG
jgi:hypothetical protein